MKRGLAIEIDTRYIATEDEKRFLKVENKIKTCYEMAILSFIKALEKVVG